MEKENGLPTGQSSWAEGVGGPVLVDVGALEVAGLCVGDKRSVWQSIELGRRDGQDGGEAVSQGAEDGGRSKAVFCAAGNQVNGGIARGLHQSARTRAEQITARQALVGCRIGDCITKTVTIAVKQAGIGDATANAVQYQKECPGVVDKAIGGRGGYGGRRSWLIGLLGEGRRELRTGIARHDDRDAGGGGHALAISVGSNQGIGDGAGWCDGRRAGKRV